MFYIITSVVISITAFSTMNEPMKNRKKLNQTIATLYIRVYLI